MAVRREQATPIYEILDHTPAIPESCQWGLFLRNHDELTLEMVTDEERDYMYTEYATDPRMKLNLGIRRRLAPLLDNGRDEIQLMTAILFSLPGSARFSTTATRSRMGDNVFLGDRDGVRTPMQWTVDRNGGFSRADFAQLYSPPLMDPVYGYQAVNVEAQLRTPTSLLRWMQRFIALRKRAPGLRPRHLRAAPTSKPADLRADPPLRGGHRAVRPQPRALSPGRGARSERRIEGHYPVELFGRLALPAHRRAALPAHASSRAASSGSCPRTSERTDHDGMSATGRLCRAAFAPRADRELAAGWVEQRWFGAKARELGQSRWSTRSARRPPRAGAPDLEVRVRRRQHELYQLPSLARRRRRERRSGSSRARWPLDERWHDERQTRV